MTNLCFSTDERKPTPDLIKVRAFLSSSFLSHKNTLYNLNKGDPNQLKLLFDYWAKIYSLTYKPKKIKPEDLDLYEAIQDKFIEHLMTKGLRPFNPDARNPLNEILPDGRIPLIPETEPVPETDEAFNELIYKMKHYKSLFCYTRLNEYMRLLKTQTERHARGFYFIRQLITDKNDIYYRQKQMNTRGDLCEKYKARLVLFNLQNQYILSEFYNLDEFELILRIEYLISEPRIDFI